MIWCHVVLAIGLVGFLSPVTASSITTEKAGSTTTNAPEDKERVVLGRIMRSDSPPHSNKTVFTTTGHSEDGAFSDDSAKIHLGINGKPKTAGKGISPSQLGHDVSHPTFEDGPIPGLGVVLVNKKKEGPLCSGFLLMKPWIAVTTAECVYGIAPSDLYVTVTLAVRVNGEPVTLNVWVQSVNIAPGFTLGNDEHNIAILIIYTQDNWDLHHFIFGRRLFTNDDLVGNFSTSIITYVNEWQLTNKQEYQPRTYRAYASDQLDLCEMNDDDFDWYCVVRRKQRSTVYGSVNVGSPFFHWAGPVNHILGIYTGTNMERRARGHSYRSVWLHKKWILGIMRRNNRPPVA